MPDVTLRPMTDDEFDAFMNSEVDGYADDIARSTGVSAEAARERAHKQHEELLPKGRTTPGHTFHWVLDGDARVVGRLWLGPHPQRPKVAYVFDIAIEETERGKGLGRATMLAAEEYVRRQGQAEIGLNVFGFNEPARALDESLGYHVVAVQMRKQLD